MQIATNPIAIRQPDGSIMTSTHEGELDIPQLPKKARRAHRVPNLANHSLISIGQLCDAGCTVAFTASDANVSYKGQTVLTAKRTPHTQLWHTVPAPVHKANATITSDKQADSVAFAHATLFSPALSTLEKAIDAGFLTNFPGLTKQALKKYPPASIPMIKGHLDQSRKNQRSTKTKQVQFTSSATNTNDEEPFYPSDHNAAHSHYCFASIVEPTNTVHTDLTGRFLTASSRGNNYIFVLYDYDSNAILTEPIKNRKAESIVEAYCKIHGTLCRAGLKPKLQRLDNECSTSLKEFMLDENIDYQLVPPGIHRCNAAERTI